MKKNYIFILLFTSILIVGLCIILLIIFNIPILCEGDSDKFLEAVKQSGDKINSTVSGNNIQNNVENPNININNPNININIPSSLGIGATTIAGMRVMARKSNNLPPTTRGILIGAGGLIGTGLFILGNRINSVVQNTTNSTKNSNNNNNNSGPFSSNSTKNSNNNSGPFSSNSIIEEGDNVESVMNLLYFNLFISICILLLLTLLIYLFKKDKSKWVIITIIFIEIFGYILFYLALNLYEDIGIISIIYQNSIDYSVITSNSKIDGVIIVKDILISNTIASFCIILLANIFFAQYINYKVINAD
jgi:hypothetical protein